MINLAQKLFKGATSLANGQPGVVPAPLIADKDKYLKGDGTWGTPSGGGSSTLAGLSDVNITNPVEGQVLQYDGTQNKWVNVIAGGLIPDGSTVTPTDDIQTWLHCANIWDKSYNLLSQVLADATTLLSLVSNGNAVNYMVRSTTWATDVCNSALAMTDIGSNNYCADTLLADSTWGNAICNSTYFESVLTTKVPVMTSATTPSGQVINSQAHSNGLGWYAFDSYTWNTSTDSKAFVSDPTTSSGGQYIGYVFDSAVKVYKVKALFTNDNVSNITDTIDIQSSSDGTTWDDEEEFTNNWSSGYELLKEINVSTDSLRYFRLYRKSTNTIHRFYVRQLQFYGRA